MTEAQLKQRTKALGVACVRFAATLPADYASQHVARQIVRCSTSVGANYRASCRARSRADMINKLAMVEEEADETLYWFEVLQELGASVPATLQREVDEILRIIVRSINTLKSSRVAELSSDLYCPSPPPLKEAPPKSKIGKSKIPGSDSGSLKTS